MKGILASDVRLRSARYLSVDEGDSVTGHIMVGPVEGNPDAVTGEVYSLNVDPGHWGRGHGSGLLAAGSQALVEAGFDPAILWVHTGSRRSRRFYEHNGWQPDGTERTVEVMGAAAPETRYRMDLVDRLSPCHHVIHGGLQPRQGPVPRGRNHQG